MMTKKEYQKQWYLKNRDRLLEKNKEYRKQYKEKHGRTKPQNKKCLNCGKPCVNKYCCNKCIWDKKHKDYIKRWKKGEETGLRSESVSLHIKKYLYNKRGKKCEKCGWCILNIYTLKIPLHFHHLDNDWRNNSEDNLQILCPNCHSLTEKYGSRNKGNGREYREKWRKNKV